MFLREKFAIADARWRAAGVAGGTTRSSQYAMCSNVTLGAGPALLKIGMVI